MSFGLDLGNLLVHLKLNDTHFVKGMRSIESKMQVMSKNLTSMGTKMSLGVTLPITLALRKAEKAFSSFDLKMTESLSIMGDVSTGMQSSMKELATSLSLESNKSADDLASSYFYLASAGLNVEQSMAALPKVMSFATAGAFDMATATDLATDAQSALGLKAADATKNMENMIRVTDTLVGANTLANATVEQFSKALTSDAGAAMRSMNIQLEEGVAVLAAYADQGLKAEEAGNMFGRMLRLMTKSFFDNRQAWKSFDIDVFDEFGSYRPLADIIQDLTDSFGKMSPEARAASLAILGFEARSQKAITPLLGTADAIREYHKELKSMGGITEEVANKQLKAFINQMKLTKHHVDAVFRFIGKKLAPKLLEIGQIVREVSLWFLSLGTATQQLLINMTLIVAATGPVLIAMGFLIKALLFMKATITIIVALQLKLLPIIAIIAAIGVGVYSLATVWRNNFAGMRDTLQSFLNVISEFWVNVVAVFKTGYEWIIKNWNHVIGAFTASLGELAKDIAGFWNATNKQMQRGMLGPGSSFNEGDANTWMQDFIEGRDGLSANLDRMVKLVPSKFKGMKRELDQVAKFTGQSFKELIDLNIQQAKADLTSFITWLKEMSSGLSDTDPSLKVIESLRTQAEALKNTIEEIAPKIEHLQEGVAESTKSFSASAIQKFQEFQTSISSITENGLMQMAQNWEGWADTVKNVLKEVYYEALRIALIRPLAQGLGGAFTSAAKGFISAIPGTTAAVPATAQAADGGRVERTGWALIHKGEEFSGVGKTLDQKSGGNVALTLHYEGQPLVERKRREYIENDQRFMEVWLRLADTNMSVQSKVRQLATS